jgi:nucleoside-diphosphate-sugar epimerase
VIRIGVLGATSHIAKDFILSAVGAGYELFLFSRRPLEVSAWLAAHTTLPIAPASVAYEEFRAYSYDAIVNFVGSGDPARIASMGAAILDVTQEYDALALDHLKRHPQTRYIFLSSGAAYGSTFIHPADQNTQAQIPINNLTAQDYYSVAKLYAETRHRTLAPLPIVDIRVFNYFSRTTDIAARYFVTDILRAIRDGRELETGSATMYRDFLGPEDFFALVDCVLRAPPANGAVDAYSREPVEKFALLEAMQREFGLRYKVTPSPPGVTATGAKPTYYSRNHKAEEFGYRPHFTSLESVLAESRALLAK